jgi:glyoxylase-like metal-dependent hydrolase (beta-lactamase superfamily II)
MSGSYATAPASLAFGPPQTCCHTRSRFKLGAIVPIPLPLRHVGSVNAWLLLGEPLTLLDTGPRDDAAFDALEAGLRREGLRLEDVELVLATHHHLDHVGLAAAIKERSGAAVAVLGRVAEYAANYEHNVEVDRAYSVALMRGHGVPDEIVERGEALWEFIRHHAAGFDADVLLADGDTIVAGGRTLTVRARPGHSPTDTLFVDERARLAFTGDHLLADISSNTEISPVGAASGERPRARLEYLRNLRRTAAMPVDVLLTGHGPAVDAPAPLVQARLDEHSLRAERVAKALLREPQTAYGIAQGLWPARTVTEQPLLVVWEVLGHLELLVSGGIADELEDGEGGRWFALRGAPEARLRR